MAPRVLISDALSPAAVQIFKDHGVEVDYLPDLGKDKDKLLEVIGQYDGLAIRSATKVTEKIINAANNLKVIGRAGIGVDNIDLAAASYRELGDVRDIARRHARKLAETDCCGFEGVAISVCGSGARSWHGALLRLGQGVH